MVVTVNGVTSIREVIRVPVAENTLVMLTENVSDALPMSATTLPFTDGRIPPIIRGSMTWKNARESEQFRILVVLHRLCGMDRTFEWQTLVKQVVQPMTNVMMYVRYPDVGASLTLNMQNGVKQTVNTRSTSGALCSIETKVCVRSVSGWKWSTCVRVTGMLSGTELMSARVNSVSAALKFRMSTFATAVRLMRALPRCGPGVVRCWEP